MKRNILVGQSGGPTAVINGSLAGVIEEGLRREEVGTVYGMINGIQGFLKDKLQDLGQTLNEEERERLEVTPASYLGSCRYKLPADLEDPVYPQIFAKLAQYEIGYFLYIGGNDSMDTVSKLSAYAEKMASDIVFIGIPKTIDNDLVMTDHTPGFGSAARFVATMVREITLDAEVYDTSSVTIVEIMGRSAGWLTASSVLARRFEGDNPALVYLPETNFDPEAFLKDTADKLKEKQNVIVCVSEGIHDAEGVHICEYAQATGTDAFGHKMLAGCGKYLENLVRSRLGVKVRSVELNVLQRCHVPCVAGADLAEAKECGIQGVRMALQGMTGQMVSMQRTSGEAYGLTYEAVDVSQVCNREKCVPEAWITPKGTDLTEAFIAYARPLIQGEVSVPMEDGLPRYLYRMPKKG